MCHTGRTFLLATRRCHVVLIVQALVALQKRHEQLILLQQQLVLLHDFLQLRLHLGDTHRRRDHRSHDALTERSEKPSRRLGAEIGVK